MATEFSTFWVITKTTGTSSNYNMYCGRNVPWNISAFSIPDKLPDLILVIENSEFKGILVGEVINELIQMGIHGIFTWMSPIVGASSSDSRTQTLEHVLSLVNSLTNSAPNPTPQTLMQFGSAPRPMAYIRAGNTLIPVPAGGTLQVVPNQFPPMMNISHYRRG